MPILLKRLFVKYRIGLKNFVKTIKVSIFFIALFLLNSGCENDPVILTPLDDQSLQRRVFNLQSYPISKSIQDSVLVRSSQSLYTGYSEDDSLSFIIISVDSLSLIHI